MQSGARDIQLLELKDTITQLNTTIQMQNSLLSSLQKQLEDKEALEAEHLQLIKNLQAELAYMKQKMFGSSSEKRKDDIPGQLTLFDDFGEPVPVIEPEYIDVKEHTKKRKHKATYEEMFANLPHSEVLVDTLSPEDKICPECGTELVPIGHEKIRTEVVFTPAKLEVIDYISTTYSCPKCKDEATEVGEGYFIKDEGKPALIPGSYASESLVAWTMYQKFCNSLPFYRQEKDFERLMYTDITRTTLANWSITCTKKYFTPMYDFFHRKLLERDFLMADETTVQVLDEEGRRPQTKSYVWLMRSGEDGLPQILLYRYTPTRAGENAAEFLKGIPEGAYLMVDGYQGYNKVKGVKLCNCWAHIRRYLIEAIPKGHEEDIQNPAVQGVIYVDKLFSYERSYREKHLTPDMIYKKRLEDEVPVLKGFWAWFDRQRPVKGTRLDRAITYIKNRRDNLERFLEDGRCSFSNNISENSIRPFTVGRKNWLFCASADGAEANAVIYTMVEMAKLHGLNIYEYLKFLLAARPSADMSDEELEMLAPWSKSAQESCKQK